MSKVIKLVNVWYGSGENAWLSNLAYRPFEYNGKYYISVEMCYQSWKSGEFDSFIYSRNWTAGSKFVGKKGTKTDKDWNIKLMSKIMLLSFINNPEEYKKLKELKDVKFTHIQDKGIWKKVFPLLLKIIKEEGERSLPVA